MFVSCIKKSRECDILEVFLFASNRSYSSIVIIILVFFTAKPFLTWGIYERFKYNNNLKSNTSHHISSLFIKFS